MNSTGAPDGDKDKKSGSGISKALKKIASSMEADPKKDYNFEEWTWVEERSARKPYTKHRQISGKRWIAEQKCWMYTLQSEHVKDGTNDPGEFPGYKLIEV